MRLFSLLDYLCMHLREILEQPIHSHFVSSECMNLHSIFASSQRGRIGFEWTPLVLLVRRFQMTITPILSRRLCGFIMGRRSSKQGKVLPRIRDRWIEVWANFRCQRENPDLRGHFSLFGQVKTRAIESGWWIRLFNNAFFDALRTYVRNSTCENLNYPSFWLLSMEGKKVGGGISLLITPIFFTLGVMPLWFAPMAIGHPPVFR